MIGDGAAFGSMVRAPSPEQSRQIMKADSCRNCAALVHGLRLPGKRPAKAGTTNGCRNCAALVPAYRTQIAVSHRAADGRFRKAAGRLGTGHVSAAWRSPAFQAGPKNMDLSSSSPPESSLSMDLRDGSEPFGMLGSAFDLLDGPGGANVVIVGADLFNGKPRQAKGRCKSTFCRCGDHGVRPISRAGSVRRYAFL